MEITFDGQIGTCSVCGTQKDVSMSEVWMCECGWYTVVRQ